METLLLTAATISLVTIGIHAATWKNMILHKPARYIKKRLPEWICKPLFLCPICMSSGWSLAIFAIWSVCEWIFIPLIIPMVAGLNTIIVSLIANSIPDEEDQ